MNRFMYMCSCCSCNTELPYFHSYKKLKDELRKLLDYDPTENRVIVPEALEIDALIPLLCVVNKAYPESVKMRDSLNRTTTQYDACLDRILPHVQMLQHVMADSSSAACGTAITAAS